MDCATEGPAPSALPTRVPTIEHLRPSATDKINTTIDYRHTPYLIYNDFSHKKHRSEGATYCLVSVIISFIFGLAIGVVVMSSHYPEKVLVKDIVTEHLSSLAHEANTEGSKFAAVSFTGHDKYDRDVYPKGLTEVMKDILKDTKSSPRRGVLLNRTFAPGSSTVLYDSVYWGPQVEDSMPQGYGDHAASSWESYVHAAEIVSMEPGCGRMQNRLVTFSDGLQACVRYRQNTDQIQGEIFSFYVGRLLNLTNLAPSVVKVVDLKDKLWRHVADDVASAQWGSNRAVVLTQYIPSLEPAAIPTVFRPTTRHLNKLDVLRMCLQENSSEIHKQLLIDKLRVKQVKLKQEPQNFTHVDVALSSTSKARLVELAQWSDLIVFDFLTANLDRIVNNLFNFQWNANIMEGPAHNLARKADSGLLVFLDNESGLLHGYRLLKKYSVYHSLMLDNLCVFRRRTVDALKKLYNTKSLGGLLSDIFHEKNSPVIRDVLPSLPEKNVKVLHERIGKVLSQVDKCEQTYR